MKKYVALWGTLSAASCAAAALNGAGNEKIVYSSVRDGNTDIYIAAPDGSGVRRLTSNPAPDQFPRCSRDGRSILFVRGDGEATDIYRLDLRSGAEQRLTIDGLRNRTPHWSPDGRRIYFTKRAGAHDRIVSANVDGSDLRIFTDGTAHDTMPAVSPDSRKLVHHSYRHGPETELHLIDLTTGAHSRLTEAAGSDYEGSFAGNDQVVFSSNRDGHHYRLYVMSLSDRVVRLLADTGEDAWGGRYSLRTGDVLFYTGRPGTWRQMRVPVGGGAPIPSLDDGFTNFGGDWCATTRHAP